MDGSADLLGNAWRTLEGIMVRTADGAVASAGAPAASVIFPDKPTGLARWVASLDDRAELSLFWRYADTRNHWEVRVERGRVELAAVISGERGIVAAAEREPGSELDLQITDDGRTITVSLNGESAFGRIITDSRRGDAAGIGFRLGGSSVRARLFEAHPRTVELPNDLDMGAPWYRLGSTSVITDSFEGPVGPLEGARATFGDVAWHRALGNGAFERTGNASARVSASKQAPCPDRTIYLVNWPAPQFADVEVTITPPGTRRGDRENGRAGLVLWQDAENYLTINTWLSDAYAGASMSCFFTVRGWEDLYDAVWSNVGARIEHGRAFRLRVTSDGGRFLVLIDDEPVVYRAFSDVYPDWDRLQIRAVGLVANWEWGLDTGSVFERFNARA
jgi:hypothetical protein